MSGYKILIGLFVCWLCVRPVVADISGTLKYPRFTFFKGRAEVVLKNVRTGEVIAKTMADGNDHFSFSEEARPLYTIIAKTVSKKGEAPKFAGEASLWGYSGCNLWINMVSKDNAISLEGRVISPEGRPIPECLVYVDPGGYGAPEYAKWTVFVTFTDSSGRWRVDRIRPPAKWAVRMFLEHPGWIGQPPLVDESLSAGVIVKGGVDYKRYAALSVWLITENMKHKLGDTAKHTTVSLPISTNNVIYVGDVVLPEKRVTEKKAKD